MYPWPFGSSQRGARDRGPGPLLLQACLRSPPSLPPLSPSPAPWPSPGDGCLRVPVPHLRCAQVRRPGRCGWPLSSP
eukprot:1294996-Heterocapsa_arctica.AAC.1